MDGKRLKAAAVFSFTALAFLSMLSGSIVPHHHHGGLVCIDLSHCSTHEAEVPGYDCHGQHESATHTDSEACCTLNVNYYLQQKEDIPLAIVSQDRNTDAPNPTYYFISNSHSSSLPSLQQEKGLHFAAIGLYPYKDFIAGATGLRAPPQPLV